VTTHHGNGPRAWRLILAKLHNDHHAETLLHAELGDCPACLAEIADTLGEIATTLLVSKTGHDASAIAESEIDLALEAADRDAKNLPSTIEWVEKCFDRRNWIYGL
jgi:hypothetical protein